jgi:hypothetical protein
MTVEEYLKSKKPMDYNRSLLVWPDELIGFMKEYAKLCCDKQREICEMAFNDYHANATTDPYCVINSPYPEELL